jgi:hypothetical protein
MFISKEKLGVYAPFLVIIVSIIVNIIMIKHKIKLVRESYFDLVFMCNAGSGICILGMNTAKCEKQQEKQ